VLTNGKNNATAGLYKRFVFHRVKLTGCVVKLDTGSWPSADLTVPVLSIHVRHIGVGFKSRHSFINL
jgi:hypothetical protein